MAGITISGRKLLKTIHTELQAKYPYLGLAFLTPEQWQKALAGAKTVTALSKDKRVADVRTLPPPPKDEKELSIHGSTLVKNFENNFLETYGIHAQVIYQKGEKRYYTAGEQDDMNLDALNKFLEKEGYMKNPA